MSVETALSRRNMHILNLAAMALITVAWLIRFYYFGKREELVEEKVTTGTTT